MANHPEEDWLRQQQRAKTLADDFIRLLEQEPAPVRIEACRIILTSAPMRVGALRERPLR